MEARVTQEKTYIFDYDLPGTACGNTTLNSLGFCSYNYAQLGGSPASFIVPFTTAGSSATFILFGTNPVTNAIPVIDGAAQSRYALVFTTTANNIKNTIDALRSGSPTPTPWAAIGYVKKDLVIGGSTAYKVRTQFVVVNQLFNWTADGTLANGAFVPNCQ